jgi:glycosyltransferase involved in cell wall biosynthesis
VAKPLVSALVPCHNSAKYLEATLESVLAQTYLLLEVIAVDDASEDGTAGILDHYGRRFPERIRVVRNERRRGMGASRNRALSEARGSLMAPLDSDDLWLPEMVAKQVAALSASPEAGFVYTGFEAFDSATRRIVPLRRRDLEAEGDILEPLILRGNFIANSSSMIRRSALEGGSIRWSERPTEHGHEDYIMWLSLALDWPAVRVDEPLLRYRRHAASHTAVQLPEVNPHLRRISILESFLADHTDARRRLERARRRGMAREYVLGAALEARRRQGLSAVSSMWRSVREHPGEAARTSLGLLTRRTRPRS